MKETHHPLPLQGGGVQKDIPCPLPPAVHKCNEKDPLPCPLQCGGALKEIHCPRPPIML